METLCDMCGEMKEDMASIPIELDQAICTDCMEEFLD